MGPKYGSKLLLNMGSKHQPSEIFWKILFRYHHTFLNRKINQGSWTHYSHIIPCYSCVIPHYSPAIPHYFHVIPYYPSAQTEPAGIEPDMEKREVLNPKLIQSCLCSHQHQADSPTAGPIKMRGLGQ